MEVTEHSAAEQIKAAERLLGATLARQLAASHGVNWESSALSNRVQSALTAVRASEREARPHAPDESDLLAYAGFDQLKAVVSHHWDCCMKVLGLWPSQDFAKIELDRLHAVRNPAQHGRTLFPHEYIEGEGLARRLRFDIERQRRTAASMEDQYWLYIEEAEDSLGNRVGNPTAYAMVELRSDQPIMVGDAITLRVRVFDPWGRKLQYALGVGFKPCVDWQDSPEFEWIPMVAARSFRIDINVLADGEPHANKGYDSFARFIYEVRIPGLPPSSAR